jgi:hypothetical protein
VPATVLARLGIWQVRKRAARMGRNPASTRSLSIHPHMLRHRCGRAPPNPRRHRYGPGVVGDLIGSGAARRAVKGKLCCSQVNPALASL